MAEEFKTNEAVEAGLLELIKERIRTPFLWLLLISWLAFNWRPILFVFDVSQPLDDRLEIIENRYTSLGHNVLYPLGSSLLVYIALPYFLLAVEWVTSDGRRRRKSLGNKEFIRDIKNEEAIVNAKYDLLLANERYKNLAKNLEQVEDLTNRLDQQTLDNEYLRKKFEEARSGLELHYINKFLNDVDTFFENILFLQPEFEEAEQDFDRDANKVEFKDYLSRLLSSIRLPASQITKDVIDFVLKYRLGEVQSDQNRLVLNRKGLIFMKKYITNRAHQDMRKEKDDDLRREQERLKLAVQEKKAAIRKGKDR